MMRNRMGSINKVIVKKNVKRRKRFAIIVIDIRTLIMFVIKKIYYNMYICWYGHFIGK